MKLKYISSCFIFLVFLSCSNEEENIIPRPPESISLEAEGFLNEILDIMEANALNRKNIDWPDFRAKVFDKVGNAQTIAGTYSGVREALILLNDNHSFFVNPDGNSIVVGTLQCDAADTSIPSLPQHIGYIKINAFTGDSNSNEALAFSQRLLDEIIRQENPDLKGWIVDLRDNSGGNMWPMLTAIGPILGEGIAGYFIDTDGNEESWGFFNGSATFQGEPISAISNLYELSVPNPKVAVLLDKGVASSGEVMAISFIERENTRSFGSETCGLSTANSSFVLSDNSTLFLTTSFLADRNKNTFGFPVVPDQVTAQETTVQEAITWLED